MENSKTEEKKVDIDNMPDKKLSLSGSIRSIGTIIGSIVTLIVTLVGAGIYIYSKYDDLVDKSIIQERDITELKENAKSGKKVEDILTASNCIELFKRINDFKEINNPSLKDKK